MTYSTTSTETSNRSRGYRQQFNARPLVDGETIQQGDEYSIDGVEWTPFKWCVGGTYRSGGPGHSRRPLTAAEAPAPTPESRLADLESRIAVLEGLVIEPAAPVCDVVAPPTVDPGEGYRLLEEGESIEEGDEEADGEEGGGWSAVSPRAAGDTFDRDNWFPVRRKLPVAERYPTTPLPEGFDRWECRGWGWKPGGFRVYTFFDSTDGQWYLGDASRPELPSGWTTCEYWEAVKDAPPKPPTYRLLNPGEIIREGDERLVDINLDGPEEWRAVITSKGYAFDPDEHLPTRRPLKSYEDA